MNGDAEFELRAEDAPKPKRGRPKGTGKDTGSKVPTAVAPELELSESESANYLHRAKRLNNPPAGLAAEGRAAEPPRLAYAYNPHRPPELRFDPSGRADRAAELVAAATQRALTAEEGAELQTLLSVHEPWIEWAGKREKAGFEVDPVALHIHERVSTQAILNAVRRQDSPRSLFADPDLDPAKELQFYKYPIEWANRMVLGDSLQVMASLARRENLAGQVQMIYLDPPYGIKFGGNFQSEVGKRDVKDRDSDLTREPEMIKAYRDTWTLGVHSYLAYLRDRLMLARELLADSGSIFVQISDENLHRVRMVMEEVFGADNFVTQISFRTKIPLRATFLASTNDSLIWFAKDLKKLKFRKVFSDREIGGDSQFTWIELSSGERRRMTDSEKGGSVPLPDGSKPFRLTDLVSAGRTESCLFEFELNGRRFAPTGSKSWKTNTGGMARLVREGRVSSPSDAPAYVFFQEDYPVFELTNIWQDTQGASEKRYVVQTSEKVIERCLLMTTDPGDLVLDPTCGSGTTAYVAEQWGRRWITCDTSRVALSLARQRLMTAKFDYYALRELNDEDRQRHPEGTWLKEPTSGEPRTLDCKTVPHVTLRSIAQNADLDPIFAKHEPLLEAALAACNAALTAVTPALRDQLRAKLTAKAKAGGQRAITDADRRRWLLPPDGRERDAVARKRATVDLDFGGWYAWEVPFDTDEDWPKPLREAVTAYRAAWRAKMDEVNACIAARAAQEELVDQPKVVRSITRVSGPFTVESVLPALESLDEDSPIEGIEGDLPAFDPSNAPRNAEAFQEQVLGWLRQQGVDFLDNKRQAFSRLEPLTGSPVLHGQGEWGEPARRVALSIGPRIGNVSEFQVGQALRQAYQRGFEELVFAGFGFDAVAQGAIQQHAEDGGQVRTHLLLIRPDATMAGLLKDGPGAQLFTAMGLPRTRLERLKHGEFRVHMEGVDIYNPVDHSLVPTGADKVAAWFLDQDYDGRAFCITQAFFPDKTAWEKLAKALKSADADRFKAFAGTESLPFAAGKHARCAVKVIDPRGNEVMTTHRLDQA
ncbi:MAG: site-specific DNA-methyltransferase [Geothrix sp.]|nr:site-specific DNA-methyltransferase [Geothrix sp.]